MRHNSYSIIWMHAQNPKQYNPSFLPRIKILDFPELLTPKTFTKNRGVIVNGLLAVTPDQWEILCFSKQNGCPPTSLKLGME